MRLCSRWITGLLAAILMVSGCVRSKKKGQPQISAEQNPEENYIKAGPRTKVMSAEQLQALVSLNEAGEMIFQSASLQGTQNLLSTPTFGEGDILVLGTHPAVPQGALRKVKSIKVDGAQVILQTEPAALTDAIEDARVRITIPLDPTQARETLTPVDGISAQDPALLKLLDEKQGLYFGINDYVLVDVDGNKATKNDQVVLNGNLGVDAGADFVFNIEGFELKEISFSVHGSQTGSLAMTGTGSSSFKEKVNISLLYYTPIVLSIGGFPVVITPSLGIALGAEGEINGKFRTSAKEEAKIKIGVGYKDGSFEPIKEGSVDGQAEPPVLQTANLSARAFASIRGNISIYGSTGAYAGMEGFARFSANLVEDSCYKAYAGVGAQAGLFAGILGLKLGDYDKSWDLVSKEIGIGSCNVKGATGQDAQAYSWLYPEPTEDDVNSYPFVPRFDATADASLVAARSRNRNGYAMKMAANGAVPYYRDTQSTMVESFRSIKALKDGGSVLTGSTTGPVVIRLDSKGSVLWSYLYKLSGTYDIGAITESPHDGSLVIAGQISTTDDGNDDMFLMKLNASGELLWAKRLKGAANADIIYAVKILANDTIVVAGSYGNTGSLTGIDASESTQAKFGWLAVLDAQGNVQRSKIYSSQAVIDLAPVNGGADGFVLGGYTERTVSGNLIRVPWVMRTQADGTVAWRQGLLEHVLPQSVFVGADGILVSGIRNFTYGEGRLNHDGWLAQLSASGNVLWARSYGSALEDGLLFAFQAANGRIQAGGYQIPGPRQMKLWYLSLAAAGDGSFREGSGFSSSNNSAALFTPPLSYTDAPLTPVSLAPVRENWDRTLKPGSIAFEDIAGP